MLPEYAKESFRKAFCAWEGVANINLKEVAETENAPIKILTADIHVAGVSFPNIQDQNCSEIAGNTVIDHDFRGNESSFTLWFYMRLVMF